MSLLLRRANKLQRQIVGIPLGTNCAPLVADLFLFLFYSYFEEMVNQIFPPELQLNKVNTSDNEAPCLDSHLSFPNGFVSSKIYNKRDEFDFDIVNLSLLDSIVPRRPFYRVYISQLIRFARLCSHVEVIEKQWTGTGAIKRQIPLLKPKREIKKILQIDKMQ